MHAVGHESIDTYACYYTLYDDDLENLDKIRPINLEFEGGYYRPNGERALHYGQPVNSDFMPKRVRKNGPKRAIADFDTMFGMALVSQKFKDVVESLEPDVHQFFPVDVLWTNKKSVEGKFYWFVVCNALDTVNAEHSDAPQRVGFSFLAQREGRGFWGIDKEGGGFHRLVYDLKAIGDHHIWREMYLVENLYCSDVFKAACDDAGIVGISMSPELEAV